jgi:hypothetical protein
MIVNEQALRGALNVLHSAPQLLHSAVLEARNAENLLKHVKAIEMKRFNQLPITGQEREAYASENYKTALERDAKAAADLVILRAKIDSAKTVIDVWRTESATERASFG